MATEEKRIEYHIFSFLRTIGIFCWKNESQGTYDPVKQVYRTNKNPYKIKGTSDILGIIAGRTLAIEVKSPTGRLTQEQRTFLRLINENGGIGFVARSPEQVANELVKHFPENERLKAFAKDFILSKNMDH